MMAGDATIIKSRNPREILNELKWKPGFDLKIAVLWYVHRGAPDDTMILTGDRILKLGQVFIYTENLMLPYHRIFKITYDGKTIFNRPRIKNNKAK